MGTGKRARAAACAAAAAACRRRPRRPGGRRTPRPSPFLRHFGGVHVGLGDLDVGDAGCRLGSRDAGGSGRRPWYGTGRRFGGGVNRRLARRRRVDRLGAMGDGRRAAVGRKRGQGGGPPCGRRRPPRRRRTRRRRRRGGDERRGVRSVRHLRSFGLKVCMASDKASAASARRAPFGLSASAAASLPSPPASLAAVVRRHVPAGDGGRARPTRGAGRGAIQRGGQNSGWGA